MNRKKRYARQCIRCGEIIPETETPITTAAGMNYRCAEICRKCFEKASRIMEERDNERTKEIFYY